MKIFRRISFALLCLGIFLAWSWIPRTLDRSDFLRLYDVVAVICANAMAIWCVAFRKEEKILSWIGWGLVVVAIFIFSYVPRFT